MAMTEQIRRRHIWLMKASLLIIENILETVSEANIRTWRDGENGWTILEILCHLRDFDGFFRHRAEMMLEQDCPDLPAYDHERLAVENRYNEESLADVMDQFRATRADFREFFKELAEVDWLRQGIHPERGEFSMVDALMQVGLHDVNHIEQITRIIARERQGNPSPPI